ncbi:MAG: bifunctional phosphopantothenoylcysteine decarboxylase/phosphopantothenate--cysteine ligase CoaBC [Breznakibacter sp.]
MLKGKKIILGVTGSIAAYKAAYLLRLLMKEGAEVQVLMTPAGKEFVTPVTMSALSNKPVLGEFFQTKDGTWNSHVDLGLWADLMLIAPASANTLGKMVAGICDNLLLTTYLSAKCPVMIAPAMDLDMYAHPATQANLQRLAGLGCVILEPGTGELASGLFGKGRMEEPEAIVRRVRTFFAGGDSSPLAGRKVMVTAGPTYEKLDPVRFIGNYSSGKMGYALASQLALHGAQVTLVTGPTSLTVENGAIDVVKVESAQQMYDQCTALFPHMDAAVMAAAVADYTPVTQADEKIKRKSDTLSIEMKATKDIAAELGAKKKPGQLLVGFALESHDLEQNAQKKLKAKNLDFIVLNQAGKEGVGFNVDTNQITIIHCNGQRREFGLKRKDEVALDIVKEMESLIGS